MNRDVCDIRAVFENRYTFIGNSIDRRFEDTHRTLILDLESRGASIIYEDDEDFNAGELKLLAQAKREELSFLRELESSEIRQGNNIHRRLFYIGTKTLKQNQESKNALGLDLYYDNPVLDELTDQELIKYNKLINARANGDSLLRMLEVHVVKGEDYFEKGAMDYLLFCLADRARTLAGFESLDEMMKWIVLPGNKGRFIFTHNEQYKDLEGFYRFISMNKILENLNVLGIPRFKVRKNALERIFIRHFELFNLDVKVFPKVNPVKGDKKLGELKDELVVYYKKYDKTLKGKMIGAKTNKHRVALDRLREKMFNGERLNRIENEIMPRIGRYIYVSPLNNLVDERTKNFIVTWFGVWKAEQVNKALEEGE